MAEGVIHIYAGDGRGKSQAAMGRAIQVAAAGQSVVFIQYLKGKGMDESDFVRRLEPEIKIFHFEKEEDSFAELSEHKKQEEIRNIQNGIHFAKKVLATGECDLLILDEVLGLVEQNILPAEELKAILESRGETDIILTGITLAEEIAAMADEVSRIETVKTSAKN